MGYSFVTVVTLTADCSKSSGLYRTTTKPYNLTPTMPKAYGNRGVAYYSLGQYQRAIQDYDEAIRLKPTAVRYTNRGVAYRLLGQYAKADADKAKACSLDSQYC